jgi:uncharacterized DUF497 family protein
MYVQSCINTMKTIFEWDTVKAQSNIKKHGIDFNLAKRAFADPCMLMRQDRFENDEYRWQTIGMVDGALLLLIAHTTHDNETEREVIRIISARPVTSHERKIYEQQYH